MDQDRLLLSTEQAVKAICLDFRGYGPQPMLFCEVLRTIHGEDAIFQREPGKNGLWVAAGSRQRMVWLEGAELVAYMCAAVARADLDPRRLAAVCRLVFQTACSPALDPQSHRPAVAIDTGMDAFACRQCGRCCRVLDYRDGISAEDVARLREMGRQDILKWVGAARDNQGRETYRIWIVPGTNRFAAPCPFLKRGFSENIWLCRIHDVKPHICRNYPVSRKHARMTGCPGFDKRLPDPVPT
jgi:Fe-S-cluster containining protein